MEIFDLLMERSIPEPNTGCYIWLGAYNAPRPGAWNEARGTITIDGVLDYVYRWSYRKLKGPIPEGLSVLHRCDLSLCWNPDHLFLGTRQDNMADKKRKGRHHNSLKTKCSKGHPFFGDNLIVQNGSRYCRICMNHYSLLNYRKHNQ